MAKTLSARVGLLAQLAAGAIQGNPHPNDPGAYPFWITKENAADLDAAASALTRAEALKEFFEAHEARTRAVNDLAEGRATSANMRELRARIEVARRELLRLAIPGDR